LSKNSVQEWDTVAANNTDAGGVSCAEGMARASVNNWMREAMAQIKKAVANQGSDIASAGTTDIGAATGQYVRITGTNAITSFGTVNAGTMRWVEFTGALTLTHNATSLKLPGSANITTAAGDVGAFVSLGAGNWKCLYFSRADGSVLSFGSSATITSTDAGAGAGPDFIADRNSASPAANDVIGRMLFRGRDSGGNATHYAWLDTTILDAADGSEGAKVRLLAMAAGSFAVVLTAGPGLQIGAPTGGDKGAGTLNLDAGLYIDGNGVAGPVYIIADQKTSGTNGGGITSGSFVKRTLNTELLDQIGITTTSSVMSVPAGTYIGRFVTNTGACDLSQSRLRDTTNSVDLVLGANGDAQAGANNQTCTGYGSFTLAGTANVELQTRVGTTNGTDGGGAATSFGTETYSIVYLEKVA
jgi:hypothetical protein